MLSLGLPLNPATTPAPAPGAERGLIAGRRRSPRGRVLPHPPAGSHHEVVRGGLVPRLLRAGVGSRGGGQGLGLLLASVGDGDCGGLVNASAFCPRADAARQASTTTTTATTTTSSVVRRAGGTVVPCGVRRGGSGPATSTRGAATSVTSRRAASHGGGETVGLARAVGVGPGVRHASTTNATNTNTTTSGSTATATGATTAQTLLRHTVACYSTHSRSIRRCDGYRCSRHDDGGVQLAAVRGLCALPRVAHDATGHHRSPRLRLHAVVAVAIAGDG